MVRSLAVVAMVVFGFGCSGDKLCPAGSEMKNGVCRISTPVGNLDLVLPMPADVTTETKTDLMADVVPADGTMLPDSTTEAQPGDVVETLSTDTVEILPTDAQETLPTDTVEILPPDAVETLPTDAAETLEVDVPAEATEEASVPDPALDTTATDVANE